MSHAEITEKTLSMDVLCGTRDEIVKRLNKDYGEHQSILGLTKQGEMMEIFKSKDGDTWSLLFSYPSGKSCMLFGGEELEIIVKKIIEGQKI